MNDVIFGLKSFIREGKQGNGASHVSIHVHNCSNKCTTDGLEHGHQKVNSTFNHLQFEDFSSRPPSPTGGVSWKPIQPVPCFITQSNQMDLNDSLEDIVQASNEMPTISTVTFPRSDKKSAAQLGCFDVVP